MNEYLIAVAVILAINLLPAFGPPTGRCWRSIRDLDRL
jgi:hypothetical protein